MPRFLRSKYFWIITALIVFLALLYYAPDIPALKWLSFQDYLGITRRAFQRVLFLIPIFMAAWKFGFRGGFTCAVISGLVMAERVIVSPDRADAIAETVMVFCIGILISWLISVQKKAEESLRKLASIVESSDDAIISKTLDGIIISWNQGAERIYGYDDSEVIGKNIAILIPPDTRSDIPEILDRIRRGEEVTHYETVRIKRDGSRINVSLTVSPVKDGTGKIIGASSIARDITERRKIEEQLKQRTLELAGTNKELETFAYSVSHDLRAPLRSMDGFSQVLLEDYSDKLDEQGKDYLQRVRAGAQRMAELIDDMLTLSRVTRSEMRREPVNLSALAKTITTELQKTQPERRVEFAVAEGLTTSGDAMLLQAALENLLGNAWKFTGKQPRARIEFGITQSESKPAYFVRDDGVGFDMAYVGKLFAPFQRLHSAGEFPGSGIGLATVQRIIHRHGGRVWAEGVVGKGATFYFTLNQA